MSELKRTHDETQVEWTIHNVLEDFRDDKVKIFLSPSFVFGTSSMCLKLAGSFLIYPEDTTLGLVILSKTNYLLRDNYLLECTYGLKNSDGTVEQIGVTYMRTEREESRYHFNKLSDVMRQKLNEWPSKLATLTITFKVKILHDVEPQPKRLRREDVLSQNFKQFFDDKLGCDTVIHVKNKEFHVHKFVLMARSKVFAAMFQHDTSEKQTGTITISDSDPDSFHEFLEYLYCGTLEEVSCPTAIHLYETSEKYNVQELKMFCAEILLENMTARNFSATAILAEKYDDRKLISGAQEYFNTYPNKVVETSEWDQLTKNYSRISNKYLNGLKEMAEERLTRSIARAEHILAIT